MQYYTNNINKYVGNHLLFCIAKSSCFKGNDKHNIDNSSFPHLYKLQLQTLFSSNNFRGASGKYSQCMESSLYAWIVLVRAHNSNNNTYNTFVSCVFVYWLQCRKEECLQTLISLPHQLLNIGILPKNLKSFKYLQRIYFNSYSGSFVDLLYQHLATRKCV